MLLSEKLADYTHHLQFSDLGRHVIGVAKQRMVDTMGCALGGMNSPPAESIRSYARSLPQGPSTIFFSGRKVAPEMAVFLNATMVRFLDYNDGYFALEPGHPSDIIPACLAVAEAEELGGEDLIVAMVIAYEIQMRLQEAANLFKRGWDHVNYVTIAATMAVGKLLKLSRSQLVHALSMAINGHVALRQVRSGELSGWKGASAANAARNALFCAYLARHGMTGPSEIFEGEMGFFAQLSGPFALDTASFGHRENQDFRIKLAKTKIYPTNGEMQTAVIAAVSLRSKIPGPDAIASVRVDTTDVGYKFLAKDKAKWRPQTRETADHSLPYTVARALLDGTITQASYDVANLADPRVLAIIDKITVHEDPVLAARMPSLANRVTIVLTNGEMLSEELGTSGDVGINLDNAEIERKFRDCASEHLSDQQVLKALELCWSLDRQENLREFFTSFEIHAKG